MYEPTETTATDTHDAADRAAAAVLTALDWIVGRVGREDPAALRDEVVVLTRRLMALPAEDAVRVVAQAVVGAVTYGITELKRDINEEYSRG